MPRRREYRMRFFSGTLAVLVALTQISCSVASEKSSLQVTSQQRTSLSSGIADVELHSGGVLSGQVIDSAGLAVAGKRVRLSDGRQVWSTVTDPSGYFVMANLSGAAYQIETPGQAQLIRAWAKGTAPPNASKGVMLIKDEAIVRGQRHVSPNTNTFFKVAKQRLANPYIFGGIVATAVAIPVAIHNADDDDPPATP